MGETRDAGVERHEEVPAVPDEEESQEESGPELAAGSGELERAAELERRAREKLARWRESEGADGW